MPTRLPFLLLLLALCAAPALAGPAGRTLDGATIAATDDALKIDVAVHGPVAPGDVHLVPFEDGQVISVRVDGVVATRRWLEIKAPDVNRVLLHPANEPPDGAVVRIRLTHAYTAEQIGAARITIEGGHVRVNVPRTVAAARALATAAQAVPAVIVVTPPPPPPPPSAPPPAPAAPATKPPVAPAPATKPPVAPAPATKPPVAPAPATKPPAPHKPPVAAAPSEPPAEEPDSPPSRRARKDTFVEGELANVGAVTVAPWENQIGVGIDVERVGDIYYGAATPQINHSMKAGGRPLSLSFGIPLRFEILDARPNERFKNAGSIRKQDWDQPGDFARVIQRITYGGKEKHFYADVDSASTTTIGHGALMRRYNPHLDLNATRISAELDAFDDFGGGELYVNDITGPNVLGGLIFLKPLSLVNANDSLMRSVSLGFTAVADLDAPVRAKLDLNDADDDGRRATELALNQDTFAPKYLGTTTFGYGVDLEAKFYDHRALDWKSYVDWSFLDGGVPRHGAGSSLTDTNPRSVTLKKAGGDGFTLGQLFRMNLGENPVHALRVIVEYRNYAQDYLPGYFDVLYEVQRLGYGAHRTNAASPSDALANGTKVQGVLGRNGDGPRIQGAYLETSWRMSHYLALAFGLEANSRTADDDLFLHAEIPHLGDWQFLTTYHRRQARTLGDVFNFSLGDTDYLVTTTRYEVARFLDLRFDLLTPFGVGPDSLFRSKVQANFGVDLGWSY